MVGLVKVFAGVALIAYALFRVRRPGILELSQNAFFDFVKRSGSVVLATFGLMLVISGLVDLLA